jgi:hypothetical protein
MFDKRLIRVIVSAFIGVLFVSNATSFPFYSAQSNNNEEASIDSLFQLAQNHIYTNPDTVRYYANKGYQTG